MFTLFVVKDQCDFSLRNGSLSDDGDGHGDDDSDDDSGTDDGENEDADD